MMHALSCAKSRLGLMSEKPVTYKSNSKVVSLPVSGRMTLGHDELPMYDNRHTPTRSNVIELRSEEAAAARAAPPTSRDGWKL